MSRDYDEEVVKTSKKGLVGGIALGIIIVVVLILLKMSLVKIPAGYVGVVYNMNGGVEGTTLSQGWHLIGPTKQITKYSIGIEQSYLTADKQGDSKDDDSFEVPSSDGKGLTVSLTFTYRFDESMVADTFVRFKGRSGEDVKDSFIKPNIISWTKEVTAQYAVTDILGDKRASLNIELTEYLQDKFAPYGIIIDNASLINIDPDDETREAIQKKVNAQQEKELAQIEADTAKINAEKEKEVAQIEAEQAAVKAQGEADALLIQSQAEADALLIQAQAEAQANEEISASLTDKLIEKIKYEQWDGALPKVTGDTNSFIDITDDITSSSTTTDSTSEQ
jgi:regulator of protease activity HflC (stomatin/prohibitin superfamily)